LGHEFNLCHACNVDFSWINTHPSILLWADKIIFPKHSYNMQLSQNESKHDKAVNSILSIANDSDLIEVTDFRKLQKTNELKEQLESQAEVDIQMLLEKFPQTIKKGDFERVPGEIIIEGEKFCIPYISSLDVSLRLGKLLHANCLFSERDYKLLKYKFGCDGLYKNSSSHEVVFDDIFTTWFPNQLDIHNYAFCTDKLCNRCTNLEKCKDVFLFEIEQNMNELISMRQTDELQRAKEEIQKIIDIKEKTGSVIDPKEIKAELTKKQKRINTLMKKVFPKVKRWTKLATIFATPATAISAITGNIPATIASVATLGISGAAQTAMEIFESKNSWVGFVGKRTIRKIQDED